jgi:hypothetical protein
MSDYGGFRAILEEAKQIAQEERNKQPEACPNDGTPLVFNERLGMLGCPMGDFRTPGRPREM